jgi:hypothetical protein
MGIISIIKNFRGVNFVFNFYVASDIHAIIILRLKKWPHEKYCSTSAHHFADSKFTGAILSSHKEKRDRYREWKAFCH